MSRVSLRSFRNPEYKPGRPFIWQLVWLFFGLPVLRSSVNLSSGFKVFLLRIFGAAIGSGVVIKPGVRVKYPWRLRVGNDCWIGEDCWIDNLEDVRLGNDVCLSQGTYFCTGNHNWSDPAFGLITKGIEIHDGAWVGARATLLPGVQLGECSIAAAGSVVTRSIPAFEIHAGNPARFARTRTINSEREVAATANGSFRR